MICVGVWGVIGRLILIYIISVESLYSPFVSYFLCNIVVEKEGKKPKSLLVSKRDSIYIMR